MTVTVNEVLDNSKDRFQQVIVIGVDAKGELDVNTNTPAFPLLHYLINRAAFKLNVYEDRELAVRRAKEEAELEAEVVEAPVEEAKPGKKKPKAAE